MAFGSGGVTLYAGIYTSSPNGILIPFTSAGVSTATWTGYGTTTFSCCLDAVAVSPVNGNVYVLDFDGSGPPSAASTIYEFTSAGATVTSWSAYGAVSLLGTEGAAVASNGNIYVTDYYANQIYEFTSSGAPVTHWTGDGAPWGVAVSPVSPYNLYVSDETYVHEYTQAGASVTKWSMPNGPVTVGSVAIGSNGNVFAASNEYPNPNLIYEFNSSGTSITQWGGSGSRNGQFNTIWGLAVSPSGDIYVADYDNTRIQVFGP